MADEKDAENIVKKVCRELCITQRELAEIIKVNSGTPAQWITKGEVPPTYQYLLELMLKNKELKSKLETIKKAHEIVSKL
ncbi:XRE family transcriptional regulator [Campylobacter mucosalis]|uniref:XRE family transcriptional regulator n=1 Tax=Campylobacter mucosalis TaxID=202 RepID=UPI0014703B63|nr:XRE family transcriptional regulator [Campylobacter mucosalis]